MTGVLRKSDAFQRGLGMGREAVMGGGGGGGGVSLPNALSRI